MGPALTSLLISLSLLGAVLDVALIILEVWVSDSFLMQRCPGTRLHTCAQGDSNADRSMRITLHLSQAMRVPYVCEFHPVLGGMYTCTYDMHLFPAASSEH